jgi:hypothetical protein
MKNIPTISRSSLNSYRLGFGRQQAQMLHDRVEESEFPSSLAVAKTKEVITGLEVPFDDLATSLDLGRTTKQQGRRTLRRALRLWDGWTLQDPDRRWCTSPARGDLLAFNRFVDDIAQTDPDLDIWHRLGQEMANLFHASSLNWPWRWARLPLIKDLCVQAGIGLAQLLSVSEADFPRDLDYPEELWGWYHVEAGMRRLLQNAVVLKRNDEKVNPGLDKGVVLGQPGPKVNKQSLATALLFEHPDWSITKIAEGAGVSRTTPYEWEKFMKAHEAIKQGRQDMPHGHKYKGVIEEYDDEGAEITRQNKRRKPQHQPQWKK